ncbi:peptidoglycan D,D-transpeptidase FtsI family protein [Luteipulveratus flavus]|uniref:Penicillin-binding transpeptidase domain-containing protein n=1 Tax=Luteipulveratus flavus TaxID=3031728 RepID=A0ABT6C503_9MICO|nr:penicillin-binding transpeptidase domain-containing protein [Luteipulveratus sp. YIM 133296]MDF8263960.1 penicillin-binding transpeptidase domain-containing protein [Luteipulveratus sp. YIM 133296]
MNAPIRRIGIVVAAMFCALLMSSTLIQFVQAKDLRERPGNRRTLLASYSKERGSILVGGNAVAVSKEADDTFKWQRTYPQAKMYAPVTGYYSFTYGAGRGIEGSYDDLLSGSSDSLFYRRLVDVVTGRPPAGATLELTVDPAVQKAAWDALGNQRGAVVALDPKTGAILAMVSKPSYDPNLLADHDLPKVSKAWSTLSTDQDHPLTNRAINGNLYPPGSTFKLITAAAALESGQYTPASELDAPAELDLPQTSVTLPNITGKECGPGGKDNLKHALKISCNTAFGSLGMALGQDKLRSQARKFGYGQSVTVPMRVTPSIFPATLNEPQLAQSAIGQFDVRATPMQVAMVSAAIANGGKEMTPYLVKNVRDSDLDVIDSTDPQEFAKPISGQTASQLNDMMQAVVDGGSGRKAKIPGMKVAGKTGTAQTAKGKAADVWFTGFAPADNPRVAVAVVVEDGGTMADEASGGIVAAPIAKKVMEAVVSR